MKSFILVVALIVIGAIYMYQKDVHVDSYTKSDGTFVKEHYRSKP